MNAGVSLAGTAKLKLSNAGGATCAVATPARCAKARQASHCRSPGWWPDEPAGGRAGHGVGQVAQLVHDRALLREQQDQRQDEGEQQLAHEPSIMTAGPVPRLSGITQAAAAPQATMRIAQRRGRGIACMENARMTVLETSAKPSDADAAARWTLVSAVLGSSMAFMDGTVVNVALPAIQRSLDASGADAQWLIEAYALFLAALLLVGGALGDRFGRKRVFLLGVAVFTAMSAACAAAQDTGQLIAARALQGIGAALLVPGSLALLGANFPEDRARPRDRHLVGVQRHHRRDRAGGRRLPGRPLLVALGLPAEPADRRRAAAGLRWPRCPRAAAMRPTARSTSPAPSRPRWAWPASCSR